MHSSLYLYQLTDFSKMFRISCYQVTVLVYPKTSVNEVNRTPKTPRQKPPPKIPNWLTKIPNKNPQKSHLNAVKMTTNFYIISHQSGRPKTPSKKPQDTRLHDIFHFSIFSPYIYFRNFLNIPLKNREK